MLRHLSCKHISKYKTLLYSCQQSPRVLVHQLHEANIDIYTHRCMMDVCILFTKSNYYISCDYEAHNRLPYTRAHSLTCGHMDEYTLVGTQVPKVEKHHVGSDVIDRKCRRLLEAHAFGHQKCVCGFHHHHFLPQSAAVQNKYLITHLWTRRKITA